MQTVESRPEIIVSPAAVLFAAELDHLDAEHMMEGMLSQIFDEWRGWDSNRAEQSIDVYRAADLPEHVDALIALGFVVVRIHAHAIESEHCNCEHHWSKQ